MQLSALYESNQLRAITGDALRPGGVDLTACALDFCAFCPGARVLDIGCGAGASLSLLDKRGLTPVGLDKSALLLSEGAQKAPAVRADALCMPFAPGSFDGALCECVLSLLPDKAAGLREIGRVLKKGGRLILSDIYLRSGSRADMPGTSCLGGAEALNTLLELVRAAGFEVLHESDESKYLCELAVQMVFAFGSVESFWRQWSGGGCSAPLQSGRFGYTLIIAEKL